MLRASRITYEQGAVLFVSPHFALEVFNFLASLTRRSLALPLNPLQRACHPYDASFIVI